MSATFEHGMNEEQLETVLTLMRNEKAPTDNAALVALMYAGYQAVYWVDVFKNLAQEYQDKISRN